MVTIMYSLPVKPESALLCSLNIVVCSLLSGPK